MSSIGGPSRCNRILERLRGFLSNQNSTVSQTFEETAIKTNETAQIPSVMFEGTASEVSQPLSQRIVNIPVKPCLKTPANKRSLGNKTVGFMLDNNSIVSCPTEDSNRIAANTPLHEDIEVDDDDLDLSKPEVNQMSVLQSLKTDAKRRWIKLLNIQLHSNMDPNSSEMPRLAEKIEKCRKRHIEICSRICEITELRQKAIKAL